MPDQHALLSASGAHRWLNCTPSARLESDESESTSAAAEQGTAAHALAEHKLRRALKQRSKRPVSTWVDDEMETLTDDYVAFVQERISIAQASCGDPQVLIEQRLDFSHVVPGGFGTGDCVIIAEPTLQIIDLKYGQGVLVEAAHNPQLMLYALGALHVFGDLYDIETVSVTIYQPRRANVDTWETSVAELEQWAETEVKPKAELAAAGGGEFCPGSWCQFCRIAPTCRARAEANLALAKFEFAPPAELTNAEIADVLAKIPDLKSWAADVEAYALSKAVNQGVVFEGFKLVAGRSVRKYTSETDVAKAAEAAGYRDIWDRKLITLTAMERLMGKPAFNEILGDLVTKPAGKPALVPASDKRLSLDLVSAATDFQPNK
ncbi:DUF2800 domain-containing protein [Corynebacterium diphtheriae bv. mitis]|uniref:DUF2800 domain-containing protein n=1 Tax=Corynebacterium diphtheriae TaxID=1717 RepID=UPI0013C944F3|nr:DUF2800 domain-containing protein [Corynebacterium diphtheriae]MBG9312229.1 DUF2800 domain-containing protein [Corynebacterium diphtheriae bv. mitis]CAB0673365.1 hypothetical protein FRC0024_00077 [Corynebacterium diphtheriae]CAB0713532.1 hypothetical protein FRC0032_02098 [Corynebacterium diphtheriae]CAB0740105.1 hypothetical protein FRC0101_02068 [Corynebacterium diphtheriae]CAB0761364.1 hypothetical protein FRC0114_02067 [Corynebacterium diphtheriae]